ncbi:hypothetical protein FRC04_006966 [Tulasnella sp. 424]|nr:hypothetical protein FRC04_006966 [Tulasnella sp. 424]KAG8960056.1 hypothetical protein FRC05_007130 [Tulasnella sp. 425]
MHVVSRWINISPSPFLQLAVATSDQLAAAITSDGAIFILPLQGGDPTILQMALTRATSIAWTSYNDLLVGFSDGLVVALSVDAKLNISVRDWIPSYFPGKILSLHSVGSLTAVTQGNTFELWKQDLHRVDGWEPVGQICVTEEDILGTWLIDEGKISILCSDCHIRFVDNTTSASALPVTGVGQGPFSAADVLPVVHSVFCAVLALAQEHRVLVYLLSVHTTGVMAVGPRTYEAEAAIMEVKLGQQVDSAFVAVDLGLEGLLCLAIPLVPGFEDFPSIKNVGIPPDQTVDSIEAKGDKIAIGLSFEHGAYGIQIHGSKSLKSDVFVFDGNGSAIRHVDLSTSLHRAIRGRKYLRHLPSIIQYPFIATAQYVPSQLKEFFFGFYWRKGVFYLKQPLNRSLLSSGRLDIVFATIFFEASSGFPDGFESLILRFGSQIFQPLFIR